MQSLSSENVSFVTFTPIIKLNNGKAAAKNEITGEMIKGGGLDLETMQYGL